MRLIDWVGAASIGDVCLLAGEDERDRIALLRIVPGVHCINLTTKAHWELHADEIFQPKWFSPDDEVVHARLVVTPA